MIRLSIYVLLLSAFCACNSENYKGPCDAEIIESIDDFNNGPFDNSTVINSINWNGNCLDVSVTYGGGCEDHMIDIVTAGQVILTDPPILQLSIKHDNTDACEALVTESISYDLGANVFLNEKDTLILSFINPSFSFTLEK